jgi:hypothetical protein
MNEPRWKKIEGVGTRQMPTLTMYPEAMNKFSRSATAFMEHMHLVIEARTAYQEAISVGAALLDRLNAGDQTMRSLMTQLDQVIKDHLGDKPNLDRKKPICFHERKWGAAYNPTTSIRVPKSLTGSSR